MLAPAPPCIVAVTGYGQPQGKQRATEVGFAHHLVKPAKLDEVLGLFHGGEG